MSQPPHSFDPYTPEGQGLRPPPMYQGCADNIPRQPPTCVNRTPNFAGSRAPTRREDRPCAPWKSRYQKDKHSVSSFVTWFECHALLNDYNESERCAQLLLSFGIDTPKILRALPPAYDYHALVRTVTEYYEPEAQRRSYRTLLQTRSRKPTESARQFAEELEELSMKALPADNPATRNEALLDLYLHHQSNDAKLALAIKDPKNLREAVNFLESYEATVGLKKDAPEKPEVTTTPAVAIACNKTTPAPSPPVLTPPSIPDPNTSFDTLMDTLVDETVLEVNATSMLANPDGSVEDPTDFVCLLTSKIQQRLPHLQAKPTCLYCDGPNHDETTCYKLIRRLHQRGFDITRYRPNTTYSRTRLATQGTPYPSPYPSPHQGYNRFHSPGAYNTPPRVYGPGQSPWSQRQRLPPSARPPVQRPRTNTKVHATAIAPDHAPAAEPQYQEEGGTPLNE